MRASFTQELDGQHIRTVGSQSPGRRGDSSFENFSGVIAIGLIGPRRVGDDWLTATIGSIVHGMHDYERV